MTHLIDKSALVKETERLIFVCDSVLWDKDASKSAKTVYEARKVAYTNVLSFINTLEVKEVDEQKERMNECPYRQVGCTMYEGHILECKGSCSWVVDYPKLKELKAQKGNSV